MPTIDTNADRLTLPERIEARMAAWLRDVCGPATAIRTGFEDPAEMPESHWDVRATLAEEDPPASGCWVVEGEITATEPDPRERALITGLFDNSTNFSAILREYLAGYAVMPQGPNAVEMGTISRTGTDGMRSYTFAFTTWAAPAEIVSAAT